MTILWDHRGFAQPVWISNVFMVIPCICCRIEVRHRTGRWSPCRMISSKWRRGWIIIPTPYTGTDCWWGRHLRRARASAGRVSHVTPSTSPSAVLTALWPSRNTTRRCGDASAAAGTSCREQVKLQQAEPTELTYIRNSFIAKLYYVPHGIGDIYIYWFDREITTLA